MKPIQKRLESRIPSYRLFGISLFFHSKKDKIRGLTTPSDNRERLFIDKVLHSNKSLEVMAWIGHLGA